MITSRYIILKNFSMFGNSFKSKLQNVNFISKLFNCALNIHNFHIIFDLRTISKFMQSAFVIVFC